MKIPNIDLEKPLKYQEFKNDKFVKNFNSFLELKNLEKDILLMPGLLDIISDNLFVIAHNLIDEYTDNSNVNGIFGFAQLLRMNFWSGIYHCQRATKLDVNNKIFVLFIKRLSDLRNVNIRKNEQQLKLLNQKVTGNILREMFEDIIQKEQKLSMITANNNLISFSNNLLKFAFAFIVYSINILEEHKLNRKCLRIILAQLYLVSLQPYKSMIIAKEELKKENNNIKFETECILLISYSYDLLGDDSSAAKILENLSDKHYSKRPKLALITYKYLIRIGNLRRTVKFLERKYTKLSNVNLIKLYLFQFLARIRNIPPILISTISKSGSTYFPNTLAKRLAVSRMKIFSEGGKGYNMKILSNKLKVFSKGGMICRQHFRPKAEIMHDLEKNGINKVIFHIRDPRQALISWFFYREASLRNNSSPSPTIADIDPFQYGAMSYREKIDLYIDDFLKRTVDLIVEWQEVAKTSNNISIKITKFEDMIDNQDMFFSDVLSFYSLKDKGWPLRISKLWFKINKKHRTNKKRKGSKNEWKDILSQEQKKKVNNMIPKQVRDLFPEHDWHD